jgi:SAM-dependent methyltransferase
MFLDDHDLIRVMNEEGMRTVLCAGNGISQEPRVLAEAGFEVIALDFSPRAIEIARSFDFPREGYERFCDPEYRRAGGNLQFAVGDILDAAAFPGPYDVIVERRTAQIYSTYDMGAVLGALAKRLNQNGILVSHCHDGAWRPPAKPRHHTSLWFQESGWAIWNGSPDPKPAGQVAWLSTTTG